MSSNFDKAVLVVLKHEGGFIDDPDDVGGATNYGVSLRYLLAEGDLEVGDIDGDGDIDADDIRNMQPQDAKKIYKLKWWDKYGYEHIQDLALATKVFDLAVNMGGRQAHKLLQRAVRSSGITLTEDGMLGPRSFSAISALTEAGHGDAILAGLRSEAAGFYRILIARKAVFKKYERGWLARAYS